MLVTPTTAAGGRDLGRPSQGHVQVMGQSLSDASSTALSILSPSVEGSHCPSIVLTSLEGAARVRVSPSDGVCSTLGAVSASLQPHS